MDILLVDDDPKVLEILGESLNRRGHEVSVASTGKQAISKYQTGTPNLVVLDMMLPDMDGIELMERLTDAGSGDVPVVFLSSCNDVETRVDTIDRGAEEYMVKPVSLREFNAKVDRVLARSQQRRDQHEHASDLQQAVSQGMVEQERVARELKKQLLSMRTLLTLSQDMNRTSNPEDFLNVVSLTLMGELQISSLAFFSLEREANPMLSLTYVRGFEEGSFSGINIPRKGRFVDAVMEAGAPSKIARNPDRNWSMLIPDLRLAVFEYVTPVIMKGQVKGLIFTGPKITGAEYTAEESEILTFVANSVGVGLENARLIKQLQLTYVTTLKTLISIMEAKDPYTKGHTERVAMYSMQIAERMGLKHEKRRMIAFGALLHDIGKLGLREEVLHKREALTEEEWEIMKSHPTIGAAIVENMEFIPGAVDIVRYHHESWDGRGYPDQLVGEDIPMGARIVAVADAFDAMTTDRSYRRALSVDEAMRRLKSGAGTQFDPVVVHEFAEVIESQSREMVLVDLES